MKRLVSVIAVITILLTFCFSVSASEPTTSFVHEETASGKIVAVPSREMYSATQAITATSLGLDRQLTGLNDLCCDKEGNVYVLVSGRSMVLVLNNDYTLNRTFKIVDGDGIELEFEDANGIYVDDDNKLYICDTKYEEIILADEEEDSTDEEDYYSDDYTSDVAIEKTINGRILISDINGKLLDVMYQPESSLFPEDMIFQPDRIVKNSRGYTYVLNHGCYYGALSYSPDGEFLGFAGSNTVKSSALDTISYLWDRLTQTDAKKSLSIKKLPYSFVDFCLDSKGYMITCTDVTDSESNGTGQIRKLSPGGDDILYKTGFDGTSVAASGYNFVEEKITERFGRKQKQKFVSIDVDKDGFIYALDATHGLIYVYDDECNMICGFSGGSNNSKRLGVFDNPKSLKVNGTDLLVLDYDAYSITVFERTEYGNIVTEAQRLYLDGEYEQAAPLWEQVLALNGNSQLAYRGLAMASINGGDYDNAIKYAKAGLDYAVYDMAWKVIRNNYISKNFIWIFGLIVLVIGSLIAVSVVLKKKNIVLIRNEKVKIALASSVHPFNSFDDIRYKGKGSMIVAFAIVLIYYFGKVLEATASGFLFTRTDPTTYNTVYTIIGTVGLVLLWSVCNWLISSLFSGKGKFKDVFIATSYALIPLTFYTYIRVVLSHVLSMAGLSIMDGLHTVILIFTFFILSVAIMTAHEYDFFKFMSTSIVTVLFMVLVVFVIFLVGVLLQQVGEFAVSVFQEVFYR